MEASRHGQGGARVCARACVSENNHNFKGKSLLFGIVEIVLNPQFISH